MKFTRKSIIILTLILFFSFISQRARAQEDIIQPAEFFQSFPEIKWGMNQEDAKKAIEKTGFRTIRPAATELAWLTEFDGADGRNAVRFNQNGELNEIIAQTYYSAQAKSIYEKWLAKLIEKQGEPKESLNTEDEVSKVWRFKSGFVIELRLIKGKGDNSYMTDIHWVNQEKRWYL